MHRRFSKIENPDDILSGDLLEDRFGDLLFVAQLEQKVHQRRGGIGHTYIGTEHEPILKFVKELDGKFFVSRQSVAAAAGRNIAVQIGVFAHKFGNGALFFDLAFFKNNIIIDMSNRSIYK